MVGGRGGGGVLLRKRRTSGVFLRLYSPEKSETLPIIPTISSRLLQGCFKVASRLLRGFLEDFFEVSFLGMCIISC